MKKRNIFGKSPSEVNKQVGAVLILFMLILVVGVTAVLATELNKNLMSPAVRSQENYKILNRAKQALIGYAVSYPDNINASYGPGYLPCPDRDDDGALLTEGACSSAGGTNIGRIPWKYLDMEEMRDVDGEGLWYVVDNNHRFNPKKVPQNSSVAGQLSVDDKDDIVAVIFAPGPPVGMQNRLAFPNDKVAYLEGENADGDERFAGITAGSFNDQLLYITRTELMQAAEKRVLGEITEKLKEFFLAHNYYPAAAFLGTDGYDISENPEVDRVSWKGKTNGFLPLDSVSETVNCTSNDVGSGLWNVTCTLSGNNIELEFTDETPACTKTDVSCTTSVFDHTGSVSMVIDEGHFHEAIGNCSVSGNVCTCGGASGVCRAEIEPVSLTLPSWFETNLWGQYIYYAVAPACLSAMPSCTSSSPNMLTVGGKPGIAAVVIATGPELSSINCVGSSYNQSENRSSALVCDYLDTAENTNGDNIYSQGSMNSGFSYWDQPRVIAP